jgi:hypothetical protein
MRRRKVRAGQAVVPRSEAARADGNREAPAARQAGGREPAGQNGGLLIRFSLVRK